jgi:hypothetical protein
MGSPVHPRFWCGYADIVGKIGRLGHHCKPRLNTRKLHFLITPTLQAATGVNLWQDESESCWCSHVNAVS